MTKSQSKTAKAMRDDIERFRSELGTDYIDLLMLHAVQEADWARATRRRYGSGQRVQAKGHHQVTRYFLPLACLL